MSMDRETGTCMHECYIEEPDGSFTCLDCNENNAEPAYPYNVALLSTDLTLDGVLWTCCYCKQERDVDERAVPYCGHQVCADCYAKPDFDDDGQITQIKDCGCE